MPAYIVKMCAATLPTEQSLAQSLAQSLPCEALPPPVEQAKVEVQPCAKLAFSARIKREALELNRRFAQPPPLYCGTVAQWLLQYLVRKARLHRILASGGWF
jgi:hypothetical protein